jgi:hypothetical protein
MKRLIAAATLAEAAFAGRYAAHAFSGPEPCYIMNGDAGPETGTAQQSNATLPSGDAARFNDGIERVCTDGAWVQVAGYGK